MGHSSYCFSENGDWELLAGLTTKESCEACPGNTWRNSHSWTGGRYGKGTMRPLKWTKREFVPKNTWGPTLDWNKLMTVLDQLQVP